MCHATLTTPPSGMTYHRRLGLAKVNLHTKFQLSNYIHYEDMNGGVENGVVWGGQGSLKVMGNVTIR